VEPAPIPDSVVQAVAAHAPVTPIATAATVAFIPTLGPRNTGGTSNG
jgi:hypothetical protein